MGNSDRCRTAAVRAAGRPVSGKGGGRIMIEPVTWDRKLEASREGSK